jgi:DNA replication and repair protein RecF
MVLGQAALLAKIGQRSSVFLIDDLGAELDQEHSRRLFRALAGMGCQVLATSTQAPSSTDLAEGVPISRFHVKHGAVQRVGQDQAR